MEMTNRRWVILVVLSCAVFAAFRLPPNQRHRWLSWDQRPRSISQATIASNLHRKIQELDEIATLIARRDSLLAARARSAGSAPLVIISAKLREGEGERIESAVRAQHEAIGRKSGSLVVGVVSDTTGPIPKRLNYLTERQFILPQATDGESCISIVRVARGNRPLVEEDRQGIFGPCAFHAAFGPPGPGVEAWLRRRGYDVAVDAVLPTRSEGNPALLVERKATRQEDLARWLGFGRSFPTIEIAACASGDRESCAYSMRTAAPVQKGPLPNGVVMQRRHWDYLSYLGPATPTFLADLLAVHGREKFARFWRSSGDPEVAFKAAFGETAGDWTMRWMRYRYGRDNRGPYIAPRSAVVSVLASLGLVGLCAAMATRRQAE